MRIPLCPVRPAAPKERTSYRRLDGRVRRQESLASVSGCPSPSRCRSTRSAAPPSCGARAGARTSQFLAMASATSVMRVQQLLLARFDATVGRHGLTFARYEALVLLAFSREGRLPMSKVGERLMVHPTSATNIIQRLAAQGLVERSPNPADGRGTLATITPSGREVMERATRDLVEAASVWAPCPAGARAAVPAPAQGAPGRRRLRRRPRPGPRRHRPGPRARRPASDMRSPPQPAAATTWTRHDRRRSVTTPSRVTVTPAAGPAVPGRDIY